MPPMGLVLKQQSFESTSALWVMGSNAAGHPVLYVYNPATLALLNTIPATAPFDTGSYTAICAANGYIWVLANTGGTTSSLLQFSAAGALLSTTSLGADSAGSTDLTSLSFDGVNTLYAVSGQGAINSVDATSLVVTRIYLNTSVPMQQGAWDAASSKLGLVPSRFLPADNTRVACFTIPGHVLQYVGTSTGYNDGVDMCDGNGFFWYASLNGPTSGGPAPTANQFLKVDPVGLTTVAVIDPAAPTPPFNPPFNQSDVIYNSTKGKVYASYVYADNTETTARIDEIDQTTNAIAILISTLPVTGSGDSGLRIFMATDNDNTLWATDGGQRVSVLDLTAVTFSTVTIPSGGSAGPMAYLPT